MGEQKASTAAEAHLEKKSREETKRPRIERRLASGFTMNSIPKPSETYQLCCLSLNIHEITYCILLRSPTTPPHPSYRLIQGPHRLVLVPNKPQRSLAHTLVEVQPYFAENKAI